MKLSNWIRFTWDLTRLPSFENPLPEHYEIGPATAEDEKELRKIISSSFVLDPMWSPELQDVTEKIESWLERAFASPACSFLALRHGTRIIQFLHLRCVERPSGCADIAAKLLFVARADDDGRHRRTLREPVDGHLRDCPAGLSGDVLEHRDDVEQTLDVTSTLQPELADA